LQTRVTQPYRFGSHQQHIWLPSTNRKIHTNQELCGVPGLQSLALLLCSHLSQGASHEHDPVWPRRRFDGIGIGSRSSSAFAFTLALPRRRRIQGRTPDHGGTQNASQWSLHIAGTGRRIHTVLSCQRARQNGCPTKAYGPSLPCRLRSRRSAKAALVPSGYYICLR
jgi:hypothetical protein